jgi:hypothetical protein
MAAQYTDPDVSRAKFDREIAEYRAREKGYRLRGWFLITADFPLVFVVMAAPKLHPPAIVTGVRLDYTNYDAEPPSVQLVNPFTEEPYLAKDLPITLNREVSGAQMVAVPFNFPGIRINQVQSYMQASSPDEVPFMCIPGVREYHSHPAHSGDAWELHRAAGAGRLVRLLEVIQRYGVEPITGYAVQAQWVPQLSGFQAEPPG